MPSLAPRLRRWPLWLALFAAAPSCGPGQDAPRLNVILISLDTLRADRLGIYGYSRDTSPALDAFADRGLVFDHAVAESPWTLPSHVTMLSGISPDRHGATLPSLRPGADLRYVSDVLGDKGYRTVGLTDGGYMGERYGFDRGFEEFDEAPDGLAVALDRAREVIDAEDESPYFLFVHTYDIHCPYDASPETMDRFATTTARPFPLAGKCGNPHLNGMVFRPGQLEHVSNAYDASIREVDDVLGDFFTFLDAGGHLDRTIVVVTSDHGEEFKEHGQIGHERSLYREVLMVPVIMVGPGIPAAHCDTPAGLADIVPTLCSLLSIDTDVARDGRPLLTRTADGAYAPWKSPTRVLTSSLDWKLPLRSTMDRTHHRIQNRRTSGEMLFDMTADPLEQTDLADLSPDPAPHLDRALDAERDQAQRVEPELLEEVTPEQAKRLRGLGYIQ